MKKLFLALPFLLILCLAAHAETLTLSTYYPAPFGSYDRLRLVPRAAAPAVCNASLEGTLYYHDDPDNMLQICQDDGTWGHLWGIWTQDNTLNDVYLTDTATNPNLQIGIGTITPESLLHLEAASPVLYLKGSTGADYSTTIRLAGENLNSWHGGFIEYDGNGNYLVIGVHDTNDKAIANDRKVILIDRGTGNIGIARNPDTTATDYELAVQGTIYANGADLAENIFVEDNVGPGDVVVVSEEGDKKLKKSDQPYDPKIAGVISTDPGFCLGEYKEGYQPLALTGQVPIKVTAENGPIKKGDLLTSSSKPGYAMKASFISLENIGSLPELTAALEENRKRQLAILGKALEKLEDGEGTIVILLAR